MSAGEFDRVAFGRNWRQFLPEVLAKAGSDADPAAVARRKAALYPEMMALTVPNLALARLLQLARSTCRTALVTTASAGNATAVLRHHGLAALFDTVVTGDDVANQKPAPDAYELAGSRLGVAAEDCLVIEDSDIGVASGTAFGATVLRVR